MKKKMGRPTNNPKTNRLDIRLSDSELQLLENCIKLTGKDKTSTIMQALDFLYDSYQSQSLSE